MRAVLGVVSLLMALAVVGFTASRQLRSSGLAVSGAASAASPGQQARQIQQKVAEDMARALEQGAAARRSQDEQ